MKTTIKIRYLILVMSASLFFPASSVSVKKFPPPLSSSLKKEKEEAKIVRKILEPTCSDRTDFTSELTTRFSRENNLPPRLVAAQIVVESSCRFSVVSRAGATGLMQVMPKVWHQYSQKELLNPSQNIEAGTRILANYVHRTGSYREGLKRYHGITPDSEQADLYASKILKLAGRKK